ncbi:hypothetical protein KEM55_003872 [Ascosphaera atra]|nr:hypothetical protein KEM55_003872 [Ascosphaera atra]
MFYENREFNPEELMYDHSAMPLCSLDPVDMKQETNSIPYVSLAPSWLAGDITPAYTEQADVAGSYFPSSGFMPGPACETPMFPLSPPLLEHVHSPISSASSRLGSMDASGYAAYGPVSPPMDSWGCAGPKFFVCEPSAPESGSGQASPSFSPPFLCAPTPGVSPQLQPIAERLQDVVSTSPTSETSEPQPWESLKPRAQSLSELASQRRASKTGTHGKRRRSIATERVHKRGKKGCRVLGVVPESRAKQECEAGGGRNDQSKFSCIFARYGCDRQFKCKNEWKRHVNTQHLELEEHLCDMGQCRENLEKVKQQQQQEGGATRSSNGNGKEVHYFNRKDLFTSHLRRHHDPGKPDSYTGPLSFDKTDPESVARAHETFEAQIHEICRRCYIPVRNPPALSGCTYCDKTFDNWGKRLEHVGKHYEKGDLEVREEDEQLRDWAIKEGILVPAQEPETAVTSDAGKWVVAKRPR